MGAWGHGPFENDGALDFLYPIEERKSWQPAAEEITAAAQRVVEGGYIDAFDGDILIAAGALVALQEGHDVASWSGETPLVDIAPCPPDLRAMIVAALPRVIDGPESEPHDLWEETDDLQAWMDSGNRVRAALA
ncbi:MAG: DUF4259 domain-containing protein [Planctomycetota bacterium]